MTEALPRAGAVPLVRGPAGLLLSTVPDPCPVTTYIESLDSAESRRTMRERLVHIAALMIPTAEGEAPPPPEQLAWWKLRFDHTQKIRTALREQTRPDGDPWSPAYVNQHIVALRCTLRFCRRHGLMSADDHEAAADIEPVKGHREPTGRAVGGDEFTKLLRACLADDDNPAAGVRDAAMFAVMHATGIRRSEVVGLRRSHYDAALRTLLIVGKGNKERTVYLHARAAEWLNAWLALVPPGAGPLFRPVHWSGAIQNRPLKRSSINYRLEVRCAQARVAVFTPHDLRRTFISNFLAIGGDLPLAQRQAGHANVATTARYDRRDDTALQETVEMLPLPAPADVHALAA